MSIRLTATSGLFGLLLSGAAMAEVPQVATDIAPVHSLVARVMQGLGEPALIVQPGASPHGYAMRPSEAQGLQDADAVFWVGPVLEPWLADAITNLAPQATAVELLDAAGTETLEFRTGATFAAQDHDDHEGEAKYSDHDQGHDDPDHEGTDPHAWLDPENAKHWLTAIAGTLGELDPENAETYAANATAGQADIDAAMSDATATLAPVKDLSFVVFHDAYHYFENRFGIPAVGAISISDASDPSPARIAEVRTTVKDLGAACVFSEPQFNQGLVGTVIDGTEARSGVIDPLGTDIATGPAFYPDLIRSIATALATCGQS